MTDKLDETADALTALAEGPASAAAETMEAAFERAGQGIERSLAAAARSGELDFSRMTQSILSDLARLAVDRFVVTPALNALDRVAVPSGGRAEGGPLNPGQAWLVGERGPEVVVPSTASEVRGLDAPVTVNLTLSGASLPAQPLNEARLARQIARAVQRGRASL